MILNNIPPSKKNLTQLALGEQATICCLKDEEMSLKLLEMGCIPGAHVKLVYKAPFNGPLCISVCGYLLTVGKEEAKSIQLRD